DAERANLVALGGWRLVDALRGYFSMRSWRADWATASRAGLARAVAEGSSAGPAAMAISPRPLGWCEGRYADAHGRYREGVGFGRRGHWRAGEATALNGAGRAEVGLGRPRQGRRVLTEALAIDRADGFRAFEARELHNIGLAMQH